MTDNWDSESGQTKFLDENGELVGYVLSWNDSQKLDYIRKALIDHLDALDVDLLTAAQQKIEAQKIAGHSCYGAAYQDGRIDELILRKQICSHLSAICGKSNNQTGGIIND